MCKETYSKEVKEPNVDECLYSFVTKSCSGSCPNGIESCKNVGKDCMCLVDDKAAA